MMNQWVDEENVTHPYIAIQFSQINPRTLQEISHTMDIKAMADTGAQCSIFTFGAIRSLGVEPLSLKRSDVSIVGVGGKPLDGIVREICIKLVNKKTGTKSYEKIYVSEDVDKSILSKDTLHRLGVLDPNLFLNETEDEHNISINNFKQEIDKRTECEKSMTKDEEGNIKCKCPKRTLPPNFNEKTWEANYEALCKSMGEKSWVMEKYLKEKFASSAMNVC